MKDPTEFTALLTLCSYSRSLSIESLFLSYTHRKKILRSPTNTKTDRTRKIWASVEEMKNKTIQRMRMEEKFDRWIKEKGEQNLQKTKFPTAVSHNQRDYTFDSDSC